MPGFGMGRRGGGGQITETAIAQALAAKGMTDSQGRAAIGGAATLAAGLRAVGLLPAATPAPTPTPTSIALPKFASALTAVKNGTADALVVDLGDSTRAGVAYGAPAGNPAAPLTNGARDYTIAVTFAARLASKGIEVSHDAWFGWNLQDTTSIAEHNAYHPRLQIDPSTWTVGGAATMGGPMLRKAVTTAGAVTFTTLKSCRYFDVWVANNTGAYAFAVDGTPVSTFATTGTAVLVKVTVDAGSEGVHTLSIDTTSAAVANVAGVIARSGTTKRVIVLNAGWRGASSADLNNTAVNTTQKYRTPVVLPQLAPALVLHSIGINDARTGGANTTAAAFAANLDALIGYSTPSSDVILSTPSNIAPANDTGTGLHMADVYVAYSAKAGAGPYRLSDTPALIGNFATLNAAGKMQADGLHITDRACAVIIGNDLADQAWAGAISGGYIT